MHICTQTKPIHTLNSHSQSYQKNLNTQHPTLNTQLCIQTHPKPNIVQQQKKNNNIGGKHKV